MISSTEVVLVDFIQFSANAMSAEACPAVGHKRHMHLINQIRGAKCPTLILTLMKFKIVCFYFLPLMKKELMGALHRGQMPKKSNYFRYMQVFCSYTLVCYALGVDNR